MSKKKLLNEYEAAARVGLSPRLLRWCTTHAPKRGISRKLEIAKSEKGAVFFEEEELLGFNDWLKSPWPHKKGDRPRIPDGIRAEIKTEANGACAICQSHGDTCEAAHLDPVSKSKNNHPENLLWLCSNHHTAYDDGLFGPDEENGDFVRSFKIALHRHKKMLWVMQDEVSRKLFLCLDDCDRLAKQLGGAKTPEQVKAIETIARNTLNLIPTLAPVSRRDPYYPAYEAISPRLSSLRAGGKKSPVISARLREAQRIHKDYVAALGFVPCPLCNAKGIYDGSDCPVCGGDREIDEKISDRVDVRLYENVECPLCNGRGVFDGADCPECGGDGELQRRFADQVDLNQYKAVKCPLCKGRGKFDGDDCPECAGDGEMPRHAANEVDVSRYEKVECPLCKGRGTFDGDDCPPCGGDGEMPRHAADEVDVSQYKKVKCPLCKGRGRFDGDDCPLCGGDGEIPRHAADQVDLS